MLPALVALVLIPAAAWALGPHQVLVLINQQSVASTEIGMAFVHQRGVPEQNVVLLDLDMPEGDVPRAISHSDFSRLVWAPAMAAVASRGIGDHILAWVYSAGFPVRVNTKPPVSIQGLTFLRNREPDPDSVQKGAYASPLFAGPNSRGGRTHFSQTFDLYREWLGGDMPLPSMMLGVVGPRGNTTAEVLECLRRGAASDGTAPGGTVYLVTSDDVRSTCRDWQFAAVRTELLGMKVRTLITNGVPAGSTDIMGIVMGAAKPQPDRMGSYLPGCMAEHLTSHAANFGNLTQTKVSAWIAAGATASAGTVTEPMSIWTKFPNARFFVHYAAGCSVIESFYQSIRSPLQILLVGDPLAQPWAPKARMTFSNFGDGPVTGTLQVQADVYTQPPFRYGRFMPLLDGKVPDAYVESGPQAGSGIEVDTRTLANGPHLLRVVAFRSGMVRSQVYHERRIEVRNP